jgi:hypothetical protein
MSDRMTAMPHPVRLPGELALTSDWRLMPTGVLQPGWLTGHPGHLHPEPGHQLAPVIEQFLRIVQRHAPRDHALGVWGGRVIDRAATVGDWHRDAGPGAARFVATVPLDPYAQPWCGHEFLDGGVTPAGVVAMFTDHQHRCPRVPAGLRLFLTAATYPAGVDPFTDCAVLADLRPLAVAR